MGFLTLYFCVLALAALVSFATLPLWQNLCWRTGLVDDPGHRKIHSTPIALAGGLAVMTGLAVPIFMGMGWAFYAGFGRQWVDLLQHGFTRRGIQVAAMLGGALGMLLLGLLDDRYELPPLAKFGGQLLLAVLVAIAGIRITLFVPNVWFSYAVTVLWILTVTNAFNFMDNMNGLCAGLGTIAAWAFAWSAAIHGQYLVALLACLSCGALVGFLPWNFPKAVAFLGDAGSHLTGYWLAVLAILPHFYSTSNPKPWAVLSPLVILAVPLLDLLCVVIIRFQLGKPFYIGDNNHLSHRLVRRGCSRTTAVLLIWLLAALAACLAVHLLT